jgi:hypothetical protein
MRRNGVPDPSWKSGPPEPRHRHSEHAIDPEPAGHDIDGVGIDEAERIDGEPLCAVREAYGCHRDGCDVDARKDHLYSLSDVSERVRRIVRGVITYTDDPSVEDEVEYLATHAVVRDYDEGPILGVTVGEDTIGYIYPQITDVSGFGGACFGREEPNPDVDAYRYDL